VRAVGKVAVVHLASILDGATRELHLCVVCARAAEASTPDGPFRDMLKAILAKWKR
jgi:hypothetical protein